MDREIERLHFQVKVVANSPTAVLASSCLSKGLRPYSSENVTESIRRSIILRRTGRLERSRWNLTGIV